jgi:hypothetical protein
MSPSRHGKKVWNTVRFELVQSLLPEIKHAIREESKNETLSSEMISQKDEIDEK